ncbi:tetratricopeptide repeat protein, partial [Endozoicomonas sp. SM1973]
MINDERGLELSGTSKQGAQTLDNIISHIYNYQLGIPEALEALLIEHPQFTMAHIVQGYCVASEGRFSSLEAAKSIVTKLNELIEIAAPRELLHIKALDLWSQGNLKDSFDIWESILRNWPLDLLAYRQLTGNLFWLGERRRMLDVAAKTSIVWHQGIPGYGYFLGPFAFALEEMGEYVLAEKYARQAVDINSADLWSKHVVAHVMEMQGRSKEGIGWLESSAATFEQHNAFKGHLWWHLALFNFELGNFDKVLQLYDDFIYPKPSTFYLDIQNAASMLTRLEFQGINVGNRWHKIVESAMEVAGDASIFFTEPHNTMALARTGQIEQVENQIESLHHLKHSSLQQEQYIARELATAINYFHQRQYEQVITRMQHLRYQQHILGGSHAQHDILQQYLIMAGIETNRFSLVKDVNANLKSPLFANLKCPVFSTIMMPL